VGEGLVENVIWGEELAENVRIPSYRGRGSKIAKKTSCDLNFLTCNDSKIIMIAQKQFQLDTGNNT